MDLNERQALFFDIDGTILSEVTGDVPESAARGIRAAKEAGHLVFINSGRTLSCVPKALLEMNFDGFLCGCGTDIIYQGKDLYYWEASQEETMMVIRAVRDCNMGAVLEGRDCIYFRDRSPRFPQALSILEVFEGIFQIRVGWEEPLPVFSKFIAFSDRDSREEDFFRAVAPVFEVIGRAGHFYEMVPKGHTKATAIDRVLELFDVKRENAWVFGDSSNDLAMFQAVPNAVAMGRHDPVLTEYASYITDTVENDGLYKALAAMKLIKEQ